MNHKHIILFTLLFYSMTLQAIEIEGLSMYSHILQKKIGYSLVLPEGYEKGKNRYPTIYMLHGLGDNESAWIEYGGIAQMCAAMIKKGEIDPFIIVTPAGGSEYYSNFENGKYNYQKMFTQELVPHIDSLYRTFASADKRAVIGYSMGGFGALMLPLNYPNLFSVSIPLSASIRTNEQYCNEQQTEWDHQWGRIFGGEAAVGEARLTTHYKENSPFFAIAQRDIKELKRIAYFIDNGDQENTLCRSNEELHHLMLSRKIPHHYRVRTGGHNFAFWRSSLYDAFRFAHAQFSQQPFVESTSTPLPQKAHNEKLFSKELYINNLSLQLYYPIDPTKNNRQYATLYIVGCENKNKQKCIAQAYMSGFNQLLYPAFTLCFVPTVLADSVINNICPIMEKKYYARPHRRFRAVWLMGNQKLQTLDTLLSYQQITACILTNVQITSTQSNVEDLVKTKRKSNNNLYLYIDTPSSSEDYLTNSYLHISLRENEFIHQYRARNHAVSEINLSPEVFQFVSNRLHH